MSLQLLLPLGLLGLIGIAVLILIYVIRPNYQTQHISSTYIWKLSLNYKRKRPPVSKIRNIIIFICQLLILASMAMLMAWPALVDRPQTDENDVIYIVDSSASMYAETDGKTRFDRALDEVGTLADKVLSDGGKVTVIVADDAPHYLGRRVDATRRMQLRSDFDALRTAGASYSVSDVEGALTLSREILAENPIAKLYLFTDTEYDFVPEGVIVENVREETEWNAAILDASAVREDGYYTVTVQIACYGVARELEVSINVEGANSVPASGIPASPIPPLTKYVDCTDDAVRTVIFRVGGGTEEENLFFYDIPDDQKFFSYTSIQVSIGADDSYSIDDHFFLYGGQKELLKVMYYSTDPNPFIQTALAIARNALAERYDLEVYEVKKGGEPVLEGYDFYVFEHGMPSRLPTDGAVLLLDPLPQNELPAEAGFRVDRVADFNGQSVSLAEGEDYEGHPVTRYLIADDIEVSLYDVVTDYDPSYDVLLSYDDNPLLMVRNDKENKVGVMAFSVHYSTLAKLPENFLIMYSLLDYFFPSVVSGNAFEVGEEFTLNTRGEELVFSENNTVFSEAEMPRSFSIEVPGSYYFEQTTYYGKELFTEVFVRPPAAESDIRKRETGLSDPYADTEAETVYRDLLLILASALVGLLFLEWILQSRENK